MKLILVTLSLALSSGCSFGESRYLANLKAGHVFGVPGIHDAVSPAGLINGTSDEELRTETLKRS